MRIVKYLFVFALISLFFPIEEFAQQRITLRGSDTFRKVGVHRGNQVRTVFQNTGVIAQPGAEGPRGAWKYDANGYVGDVSPLIGLRLPIKNYAGTLTDEPDTIHSVIITPVARPGGGEGGAGKIWGLEPIAGFYNASQPDVPGKGIAMSHQPETWPSFWPDYPTWNYTGPPIIVNGVDVTPQVDWNGYFGRAQFNADQESYWWMDDYNDEEFQLRYGFISDTTNPGRTGHSIQVNARGMQWSNFLAQDVIFWLYNISNDGTATYDQAVFGTLVGTYIGVEPTEYDDDASFFNVRESITYTFDFDKYISPAANPKWLPNPRAVGYIAYAFLESPGNPFDGVDNDGDNKKYNGSIPFFTSNDFPSSKTLQAGDKLILTDKNTFQRASYIMPSQTDSVISMGVKFILVPGVTKLVEGDINPSNGEVNVNSRDGIDNDLDGLIDENYQLHYRQFKRTATPPLLTLIDTLNPVQYKNYITGVGITEKMIDEARDDGIDNDNDWDINFDDVGENGRDDPPGFEDNGEGDGIPTLGEPNFDRTDVDESDQIGLTSFQYFAPANDIKMNDDENMWSRLTPGYFDVPKSVVNNVPTRGEDGDFMYGSGYFPLLPGKTERFSLALAFGDDLPAILKTKQIAQTIYNANYNFPKPPLKPTVTAVPGDEKVFLYWDKVAESSVDPTLKERDFEGYKIYKGTDPDLSDALQITDGSGVKKFYKPIAQFDLINGITGYFVPSLTLLSLTNGIPYYLGSDNGIQNFYEDNDVINGRTYYYAVVAYDRGKASQDIFPSENTRFISKDALGKISTDINTVAVIPNAPVLGYVAPKSGVKADRISGVSTSTPIYEALNPFQIQDSTYEITFTDRTVGGVNFAQSYTVKTLSGRTIINEAQMSPNNGDVFNGVRISFDTSYQTLDNIKLDTKRSGWNDTSEAVKFTNLTFSVSQFTVPSNPTLNGRKAPKDYAIVFYNSYTDSSNFLSGLFGPFAPPARRCNYKIYDITNPQNVQRIQFALTESGTFRLDTLSRLDQITLSNANATEVTWKIIIGGDSSSNVPKGGDTLFIRLTKPLASSDKFSFTTSRASYNSNVARDMLERIKAVPNPYVVTNVYEQPLPPTVRGRGERVINFINLPPKSKIHIYTSSGSHIRTLDHDGDLQDGSVTWDVRTKEGLDVAYGVYFYVVEVDGISDKKTGKLAIIK